MMEMQPRPAVANATPDATTHLGLWLTRYPKQARDGELSAFLGTATSRTREHPDYRQAFQDRADWLCAAGARAMRAKVSGRMVCGIGEATPFENGLSLEHTWGVPVIPGSSLKGIASAAAATLTDDTSTWRRGKADHRRLFGESSDRDQSHDTGIVRFHDAWMWPSQAQLAHQDVMTVHHQGYYSGQGAPSPMDSPIPIPFVSVAKCSFLVLLDIAPCWRGRLSAAEQTAWLDASRSLLGEALSVLGVGAKTGIGYGRLSLGPWITDWQ